MMGNLYSVDLSRDPEEAREIAILRAGIECDGKLVLDPPATEEEIRRFESIKKEVQENKAKGLKYEYMIPFD